MQRKTIGIDFDGVIHQYSRGWYNGEIYDEPVYGCITAIQDLLADGYSVCIFSSRNSQDILEWMKLKTPFKCEIISPDLDEWSSPDIIGITNKKMKFWCLIDDRAIKFEGDWNDTFLKVIRFKTYQSK